MNDVHQGNYFYVSKLPIHHGSVIDEEFLTTHGLARGFFDSINTDPFIGPKWENLFQINEPVYGELVWEFFASFEFDSTPCRCDSTHVGVSFRLGGETQMMSLLELRWMIGLYSKEQLSEAVTCNIPYWLARDLKSVREKDLIYGGMFVTRVAWSFRLLTNSMVYALSVEPKAHIFKKKFLIAMNVLMDLGRGSYCWPATRAVRENAEKTPLPFAKSSSPVQFDIKAAESLFEYELKNTLYTKMHKSQYHLTYDTHQELYDTVTWLMLLDEATMKEGDKPDKFLKKKDHGDDQDEDPSARSNQSIVGNYRFDETNE
uniref:Uncharacterized protein n=1 Tax=Tanacetum cinerariifolium TaxID=118510 RepID=A0A6L2K807_TANCI|nr:hypothetical protein [Tanacetum cinerariifolium]